MKSCDTSFEHGCNIVRDEPRNDEIEDELFKQRNVSGNNNDNDREQEYDIQDAIGSCDNDFTYFMWILINVMLTMIYAFNTLLN